jgi:tetratricopeptide (TPR) repeat protein
MFRFVLQAATFALLAFATTLAPALADDAATCRNAGSPGDDRIAACSRIIERNPNDAVAYYNRGDAYSGAVATMDRAIADLDRAILLNSKYAEAYYRRGGDYGFKGDHDREIADYTQAIALSPKYVDAYHDRGYAYMDKGDRTRANADFEHALRLDPNNARAFYYRCWTHNEKGEYDLAIAACGEAARLDPKIAGDCPHVDFNVDRAEIVTGGKDTDIADCDMAISLKPDDGDAHASRGAHYSLKGEYDRAIADIDRAIRSNLAGPPKTLAYVFRCVAYNGKGEYDRAMAECDTSIGDVPPDVRQRTAQEVAELCKRFAGSGGVRRYDVEIAICNVAIRLDPKNVGARMIRGAAFAGKGENSRAVADYDQALKLDPSLADARQGLERAMAALAGPQSPKLAAPVAPAVPGQPTKRALVIGIDAYPGLARTALLERAVADAEAVGDRLASLGFQVTRLTSPQQSSLAAILRGFDDFRKSIVQDDMVVLFYAGHGMSLSDGTYLLPGDVSEANLEVETMARRAAISENELTNGLRQARARIVVAVIDACRNDLFSRTALRSVANERGLRPAETEGIFKLYSASEGQTALDRMPGSDTSKNSVFTRVFLKAIGTPGLDLNRLGATVRDEVHDLARTADHQQTPAVYDKLIGSTRVYFVPETAATVRR